MKMKLKVFAKNKEKIPCLKKKILKLDGSVEFSNKPDFIFCFGGDGTLLHAERLHPSIPKLAIRDMSICRSCNSGSLNFLLKNFFEGKYKIISESKLVARINNKELIATNDVVIRNADQHHAIRFDVKINNRVFKDIIGDGVVISTAFGSSAYFNSITRKTFKRGLGVAFNNTTIDLKPVIGDGLIVKFKLIRNKAYLTSDNHSKKIILNEGDVVDICESSKTLNLIKI
jgi:NAD+ kinase